MADYLDNRVFYTLYENLFDNRIVDSNRFDDVSWSDFVRVILDGHQVIPRKEDAKLIAPVRFLSRDDEACQHAVYTPREAEKGKGKEGEDKLDADGNPYTWRGAVNVDAWSMLPVDIDGQQSMEEAKEFFSEYTYVGYTSYNHLKDGVTEKFRLLLLLDTPVPHHEFSKRLESIKEWLNKVDISTVDASRGFYLPSCSAARQDIAQRWYNAGNKCLDIYSFEVKEPSYSSAPLTLEDWDTLESDEDRRALLDLLREVYLGDYEQWWKVSSAMAGAGFTLDDFKYVTINGMMSKKDASACAKQWQCAVARDKRGNSIHVGYLYNLVGGVKKVKKYRLEKEIEELESLMGVAK